MRARIELVPIACIAAIVIMVALVLPFLQGCTAAPIASQPVPVQLTIAKVQYGFEATYNVAATAYLEAVRTGQLQGINKVKAKALLVRAWDAVLLARTARRAGDAAGLDAQAAVIAQLTVQVLQLVKHP